MKKIFYFSLAVGLCLSACTPKNELTPGMWRAVLGTESGTEIPFNFDLQISPADTLIYIITGADRYEVKDVKMVGDSLFVTMPLFSSRFALKLEKGELTGQFIRSSYTMPVKAVPGVSQRFTQPAGNADLAAGRWLVNLGRSEIIGEFEAANGKVTGSFLTPTGDYRLFEGIVDANNVLWLSCFDGGFIRLFTANIVNEDTMEHAKMYSGFNSVSEGAAIRKSDAELPDAYAVTGLKKGYTTLGFSFPNLKGEAVSLRDARFKDKVVIVQISGSWCPNCLDESRFLMEMQEKYSPNVEMLCVAFERVAEYEAAKKEAMNLVTTAGITYEVLLTGHTTSGVRDALPELENFASFPTTIIIDKKGKVRHIHSGFSGPGTGVHYRNFVKEFQELMEKLIAE
jgi:Peroxiredoxin